jgi:hypothetical protein
MENKYIKIYERFYDGQPNGFSDETHNNQLLGEFEIIYGDINGYAFSAIGVKKDDGKIYNIVGDEVSGFYHRGQGGTKITIYEIVLKKEYWV